MPTGLGPKAPLAGELPYTEVRALAEAGAVALLPLGSTEAHGPHLPLETDVLIARAVCDRVHARLPAPGAVVFPAVSYGVTEFARPFSGTISLPPAAVRELVLGVARGVFEHGFATVALVCHHLEPAHFRVLYEVRDALLAEGRRVVLPDHRKKPIGPLLGDEFNHGGAHAGFYETSLVLAAAPEQVREAVRRALPKLEVNLAQKIKEGAKDFLAVGGRDGYLGDPAAASAADGERLLDILAQATADAVLAAQGR